MGLLTYFNLATSLKKIMETLSLFRLFRELINSLQASATLSMKPDMLPLTSMTKIMWRQVQALPDETNCPSLRSWELIWAILSTIFFSIMRLACALSFSCSYNSFSSSSNSWAAFILFSPHFSSSSLLLFCTFSFIASNYNCFDLTSDFLASVEFWRLLTKSWSYKTKSFFSSTLLRLLTKFLAICSFKN